MRILIIRLSALGDVAMSVPAIYSLARQYPHLRIEVLTRLSFAQLFADKPSNIHLIKADFKGKHKGWAGMYRLLKELKSLKPDYVADLHNVLRSWIIDAFFILTGKKVVMVDKQRTGRRKVLHGKGRQPNFVNRYADVFSRLGFPINLDFRSVFGNSRPTAAIPIQHPAIGIAPFARYQNKTYPVEKMRQVAELLAKDGFNIYLFGGGTKEIGILNRWQNDIAYCTSLAGKFSLSDELSLMNDMDVMITMDSANQHLASAVGTKVLTIWGSTTPACGFLGYGQKEENGICLNLPCQPCSIGGSEKCKRHDLACLHQIAAETIVTKVKQLI